MKILTSQQIYLADNATVQNQKITLIDLMERAATVCVNWIHNKFKNSRQKVLVFCGVGNNGGDGLVIARQLFQKGYNVDCFIVEFSKNYSDDFKENLVRLNKLDISIIHIKNNSNFPDIKENNIVIDAVFGIGLAREITGFTAKLIQNINLSKAFVLSIDIPSGMFESKSVKLSTAVISADICLTFQQVKYPFLLPENEKVIFNWEILDIGLDKTFIKTLDTNHFFVDKEMVKSIYKTRSKFSHKGTFGHSLLIGGSFGKIGALVLAAKAALKSGSGLVTAYSPKCGCEILQTLIPEAMVEVDTDKELEFFNYKSNPTVIGVGPGMGISEKTVFGFSKFLKENTKPLIIDADALNILSRNNELIKLIPHNSILTPHPKEFERLVGSWKNDFEKIELLKKFSSDNNLIVILKGAHTIITKNNQLYFNSTGNPALATAGSGDVLTGIITGLVAQQYNMLDAAVIGVYLHGLTADLALQKIGTESFIASTIIEYLGAAFLNLVE